MPTDHRDEEARAKILPTKQMVWMQERVRMHSMCTNMKATYIWQHIMSVVAGKTVNNSSSNMAINKNHKIISAHTNEGLQNYLGSVLYRDQLLLQMRLPTAH
jgi:hypothetical protein